MIKNIAFILFLLSGSISARNHYTGFSGAPGSNGTCTNSCHGQYSFPPTVDVTGFPEQYEPGQYYFIGVGHRNGSAISQFNASIRIGLTEENAGQIVAGPGTEIYNTPGETNGIHWSDANSDSGIFVWIAPNPGVGEVRLYWAGLQGSRVYGTDVQIVEVSEDVTADVEYTPGSPMEFSLKQNYPNPFNLGTNVEFTIARSGPVEFIITNILGQVLYSWTSDYAEPGTVTVHWDGFDMNRREQPSGVYFYRLKTPEITLTNKMMILR
ncbi:MAG: T9SS type A sorting domain-containing protein [Candidatus Zixiibacteriota bacterium]|nr:MAG: T9SS type A sorting domain-containing protein [candidate division Zixibacteria bacterium]